MSVLTLAVAGAAATVGTYSAFSSTTTNPDNRVEFGTVHLSDNDVASAMYQVSGAQPGDVVEKCIKVTYTGSLAADVKLYSTAVAVLGDYIDLVITPGTNADPFPDCTNFVADAGGAIYTGTLKGFADAHTNFATGVAFNPSDDSAWDTNDAVVFKFHLTVQDANAANGGSGGALSTGDHDFTFEAQNQ